MKSWPRVHLLTISPLRQLCDDHDACADGGDVDDGGLTSFVVNY